MMCRLLVSLGITGRTIHPYPFRYELYLKGQNFMTQKQDAQVENFITEKFLSSIFLCVNAIIVNHIRDYFCQV